MQRIVIVGAGGHGREIADILMSCARRGDAVEIIGYIDEEESLWGREISGFPVLGGPDVLAGLDGVEFIVAFGSPTVARRHVERIEASGRRFARAVAPSAVVSPRAALGSGVVIFPNAVVGPDATIGNHATVNVGATISHDCRLEEHVVVNPGAHLAGNVTCGVGAYIGMGACIIQGRSIGAWATIGAGAVVISDIPGGVTAVGVPARVVRDAG